MRDFNGIYAAKRVLLTGHTGFKGAWLAEWLLSLGAEVHGYALDPTPDALLFSQLGLGARLATDSRGDVADSARLARLTREILPEFIFHLAAQPLVRLSYQIPVATFATNVMGTVHVMDALRCSGHPCVAVMVTTDKCYENHEWLHAYREVDAMGGYDPYSASKGAAELTIAAYRQSFFSGSNSSVLLASARAGNVVGGGDWAQDRIVPDCFRALAAGRAIVVRNRNATRPWQHVLEPLSGYLQLGATLWRAREGSIGIPPASIAGAFNFGPALGSNRSVAELVQELLRHTGGTWTDASVPGSSAPGAPHEASRLNLATDKAFHLLGWQPVWDFSTTMARTAEWYHDSQGLPASVSRADFTRAQIMDYATAARAAGLSWAAA